MTENPDAPPPKNHDEGSDEDKGDESDMRQHEFKWYLKSEKFFKIVTTRWGIFTIISAMCYVYEIIWTISGVNNYCDITRTLNSNKAGTIKCIATLGNTLTAKGDIATVSAVYDFPILIVTIYHMIEWIRWTILATCALVDANLIPVFYVLHLNICFGFFAMLIAIIGGSTAAAGCADAQPERARYL